MMKRLVSLILGLLVALGSFSFALAAEVQPVTATVSMSPDGDVCIVGHRATLTAQAEGVTKFTWKSSAPKIASVSAGGVVQFKKPGDVTITATAKGSIKATGTITLKVVANRNEIEGSRVYLKGNYVYADVLYTNTSSKSLKKLGATQIALTGIADVEGFAAKKGIAKKAVKPGESGYFTFKLMKVKKAEADLTKAVARIVPAA